MGTSPFSLNGNYRIDVDGAVSNNQPTYYDVYWRVLVWKDAGSGLFSGPSAGNSGWADSQAGIFKDLWQGSGFAYDFRTSSGVPVGGNVMFRDGTTRFTKVAGVDQFFINASITLDGIGTAEANSGVKVVPEVAVVPPAPTAPAFSLITKNSMRVTFNSTGTGSSPIIRWELERSTNAAMTGATRITSSGTSDITGLNPKTRYYYRARGVNAVGNGAWSAITNAATYDVPETPTAPTTTPTSTEIALATVDPANNGAAITAREMQLSTSATFATIQSTKTVLPFKFTAADGVIRNTQYYVRWRVQNSQGWSAYSAALPVRTLGTPPTAPTGYIGYEIATTSAKVTTGTIADNGGGVPSAARIKVSTAPSDAGVVQTVTQNAWAPVLLTGLSQNVQYYVAQAAFNDAIGGGWGPYGPWVGVKTSNIVPNEPVLSASFISDDNVTLSWTIPSLLNGSVIMSYEVTVARDTPLTLDSRTFSVLVPTLSRIVDSLVPATQYYASVRAISDKGIGSSAPVLGFATTGAPTDADPLWYNLSLSGTYPDEFFPDEAYPELPSSEWVNGTLWIKEPTEGASYPGSELLPGLLFYPGDLGGIWREVIPYYNDNNIWRRG